MCRKLVPTPRNCWTLFWTLFGQLFDDFSKSYTRLEWPIMAWVSLQLPGKGTTQKPWEDYLSHLRPVVRLEPAPSSGLGNQVVPPSSILLVGGTGSRYGVFDPERVRHVLGWELKSSPTTALPGTALPRHVLGGGSVRSTHPCPLGVWRGCQFCAGPTLWPFVPRGGSRPMRPSAPRRGPFPAR